MRIALVVRAFPPACVGGLEVVCSTRAEALAECGLEVHVLTTCSSNVAGAGVIVHNVGGEPGNYSREFIEGCVKEVTRLQPDIVHLDSFCESAQWWRDRPASKALYACTVHGIGIERYFSNLSLYRLGMRGAPGISSESQLALARALSSFDRMLTVNRFSAWVVRDLYGVNGAKVVYNPINSAFFAPTVQVPKDGPVGAPGTRNPEFVVAALNGTGIAVRVAANIPQDKMPDFYDGIRCFVNPAFWTCYDLTVAEAIARGRHVIVSNTGAYHWELAGVKSATLVPMGDMGAMRAAVAGPLTADPTEAARHRPDRHAAQWLEACAC